VPTVTGSDHPGDAGVGVGSEIDHQRVARVVLPVGGRLRGARVPDPAGLPDGQGGVAVAEGDVGDPTLRDRGLHLRDPDGAWLLEVATDAVRRTVTDDDPDAPIGGLRRAGLRHQVGQRPLARPRRTDDLDAGDGHARLTVGEHLHVGRTARDERVAAVDRAGVVGIVVPGQEVDRHVERPQSIERATDRAPVGLVGLEHVTRDHHERTGSLPRHLGGADDRIET
jgi:hypothetical protein